MRVSPETSLGRPYSLPSVSRIYNQSRQTFFGAGTSTLTRWPSPLLPLTVAVTTTRTSRLTKLRIHRGWTYCACWAGSSKRRPCDTAARRRSERAERNCIVENGGKGKGKGGRASREIGWTSTCSKTRNFKVDYWTDCVAISAVSDFRVRCRLLISGPGFDRTRGPPCENFNHYRQLHFAPYELRIHDS
jgi:hypothetical protein